MVCSVCLFRHQGHFRRDGTAHSGLDPSTLTIIQENALQACLQAEFNSQASQACLQANLLEHFLNSGFFFSDDSSLLLD